MAKKAQWQEDLIAGGTAAADAKAKKRWTPFQNIQQGLGFFGGKPGGFLANKEQRDAQNLVEAAIAEPTTQWGQNLVNTGSIVDPNSVSAEDVPTTETSATEEGREGISPWWNLLSLSPPAIIDRMIGGPFSRSLRKRKLAEAKERLEDKPPPDVPFQWAKMFTHDAQGNELSPEVQKKYKDAYHQYMVDKEAGYIDESGEYDPPGWFGKGKKVSLGERYGLYDEFGDPVDESTFRSKLQEEKSAVIKRAKNLEDKRSRRREAGFKTGSSYLKDLSRELMQPYEYKEF
jgi:hypothetical protein